MKTMIKILNVIQSFLNKMKNDAVSAFAAQTAFFIVLSFIPFLMLLLTLIQYLPISETALVHMTGELLPHTINNYVISLINEIYSQSSATIISVTALMALWSASKGFLSMIHGFNFIYKIPETRNYIKLRLIASLYTLIFAVTLLVSLTILVFGNKIFLGIMNKLPFLKDIAIMVMSIRSIVGLIVLFLIFSAMYLWIPNFKCRFVFVIPGAIVASIGWMSFSFLYSLYIDNFANFNTYGSLTVLIFCMLWLYACMYILFIGCEINDLLYRYLTRKEGRN
ncbi:MAG: YihY/virulence factor BrkB family protein [Velocimicrobium sp.]